MVFVSINQMTESAQRGHQVGQIRLVYEHAEKVAIWLGRSTDDMDFLMGALVRLDKAGMDRGEPRHRAVVVWKSLWRAYWYRLPEFAAQQMEKAACDVLSTPRFS